MTTANVKKKIQIPPIYFNEVLQDKTLRFWRLSNIWNGKSTSGICVGDALSDCNEIQKDLNPNRPLSPKVAQLKDDIVMYGSKHKKRKELKAANDAPLQTRITIL